jgi:septal ring factor EnvC (AmiA/AmiB activator)
MNVVEVTGETVSKVAKLVKQAGEQQRAIVLELSRELGEHNILLEKALEKQNRLAVKVQRIEDHIMKKELYNFQKVEAFLANQKAKDQAKRAEITQSFSS